jgi:hypothetical protein
MDDRCFGCHDETEEWLGVEYSRRESFWKGKYGEFFCVNRRVLILAFFNYIDQGLKLNLPQISIARSSSHHTKENGIRWNVLVSHGTHFIISHFSPQTY